MESWVGDLLYTKHFYSQYDCQNCFVWMSRILLDQLASHLSVIYERFTAKDPSLVRHLEWEHMRIGARDTRQIVHSDPRSV